MPQGYITTAAKAGNSQILLGLSIAYYEKNKLVSPDLMSIRIDRGVYPNSLPEAFDEISDIEINPLILFKEGKGSIALDARILLSYLPEGTK